MKSIHIMAKPHGPICNLDCTYCYYLEKEHLYAKGGRDFRMPDDVLDAYVRQYIRAQPGEHVSFAWQGGEPTLLGIPFFKHVVELQKNYGDGRVIDNAFQTTEHCSTMPGGVSGAQQVSDRPLDRRSRGAA